jgi:hypothetical protein
MENEIGTYETDGVSRIRQASEAIRHMADDLRPAANGLEPFFRRIVDEVYAMTRQAPLQSLAVAFLLGAMFARRR